MGDSTLFGSVEVDVELSNDEQVVAPESALLIVAVGLYISFVASVDQDSLWIVGFAGGPLLNWNEESLFWWQKVDLNRFSLRSGWRCISGRAFADGMFVSGDLAVLVDWSGLDSHLEKLFFFVF